MTIPTDAELLPCPFCGAAAHFEIDDGRWEWVECESCGMQGNRSASLMEDCKPKLREEWNRRTPLAGASGEPEGWITWWPVGAGRYAPGYSHGPIKPNHGPELDEKLRKYPVYLAPPPQAVREPTIQWPKTRDVGRIGDMSPDAHLRVGLDSDNDVYVSVWDEHGGGSVEFCNGGGGGGQSSRTRLALIALMVAMEADNAEKPSRDWWAKRMGGITKGGQHGAE